MRKYILLNLAGAAVVAASLFGASTATAKTTQATPEKLEAQIIKTSELPTADVINYPESQLYQKPGAPVRYSYSIPKNIEIGQAITFNLRLSEPFQSGSLQVRSAVRGDVRLLSNSGNNDFSMSGENGHDMNVTFVANSAGRHYIQFQAISDTAQGTRARAFSIPIQVGPKQPLPVHPNLTTTATGETIISMRAVEEVR
ncbi:MAG: hypothetical protein ABJG88_04665 [Litorimonas sp.]